MTPETSHFLRLFRPLKNAREISTRHSEPGKRTRTPFQIWGNKKLMEGQISRSLRDPVCLTTSFSKAKNCSRWRFRDKKWGLRWQNRNFLKACFLSVLTNGISRQPFFHFFVPKTWTWKWASIGMSTNPSSSKTFLRESSRRGKRRESRDFYCLLPRKYRETSPSPRVILHFIF